MVIIESDVPDESSRYNKDNYIRNEESDAERDDTLDGDCADEIWVATKAKGKQTRMSFPTFSRACDRYGITDGTGADLASSILHDISNQVTDFKALIINKNKVRREKKKMRKYH